MANLPTRIRQNIRDHITSPTSALSLKFKTLSTTLGYPVAFEPEWPILWSIFEAQYRDPGIFVPSVAAAVIVWCDTFVAWLERDENEESVDELLDALKTVGRLELVLNTSNEGLQATTRFDPSKRNFELVLPASKPIQTSGLEARFASGLLQLFNGATKMASTISAVAEDPEWADVSILSPIMPQVSETQLRSHPHEEAAESLPDIAMIQRPEELIKKPPYWLIVRQERSSLVRVEGSHGPSLAVLEAYLKKWCRGETTRVDRPPVVDMKLRESPFGLGVLYDTLVLETNRGREISATLVLMFVENVLGYVPEHGKGSAGSVWEFKRTRPFK